MYSVVRVKDAEQRQAVIDRIKEKDSNAEVVSKDHPKVFEIETDILYFELEEIEGVESALRERDACTCGSGLFREELSDARGIFCCYTCEECEQEKRSQYRVEVLEDSNYECDEVIEPEDY